MNILLDEDSFYKHPDQTLLYYLEKAGVQHHLKNWSNSNEWLQKALNLYQEFYTAKIRDKVSSFLVNDQVKRYEGRPHEISSAYRLMVVNFLMLLKDNEQSANNQSEQAKITGQVRASLLSWYQFLEQLKDQRWGKKLFKNDSAQQLLGVFFHLWNDSRADDQTAFLLLKSYLEDPTILKIFKDGSEEQQKKLSLLVVAFYHSAKKLSRPQEGDVILEKIQKNYLKTPTSSPLSIDWFVQKASLSPGFNFDNLRQVGLVFKWENSFKGLRPEEVRYGLTDPKNPGKSLLLTSELGYFASSALGLRPTDSYRHQKTDLLGAATGQLLAQQMSISFELPTLFDQSKLASSKIKQSPYLSFRSTSSLMAQALVEEAKILYPKIGIRLATKYVAALGASYLTYKSMAKKNNPASIASAKSAAALQFFLSSQMINSSEKADVRSWMTIPEYWWVDFIIPNGQDKKQEGQKKKFSKVELQFLP